MELDYRETPTRLWRFSSSGYAVVIRSPVQLMSGMKGGNRWDDPCGQYGLLYVASEAEAAIAEVVGYIRAARSSTLDLLTEVENVEPHDDLPAAAESRVHDWIRENYDLFELQVDDGKPFVDATGPATVGTLAEVFPDETTLAAAGSDFGPQSLRRSRDRFITRPMGCWLVHEWVGPDDGAYGIHYLSWYHANWSCWAVHGTPGERPAIIYHVIGGRRLEADDPLFQAAVDVVQANEALAADEHLRSLEDREGVI